MTARIDLHIHTTYSDGLASPKEVIAAVRKKGLAAFAVCDHDNFDGYFETKTLLRDSDAELIPGTELSSGQSGEDIHILGYFFDPASYLLKTTLENFREKRNRRGEEMLLKLKRLGVDIPLGMVREIAGDSAIGRPHIADAIVRVKAVRRYEDAFARYIGIDGPAYVPKSNLPPKESIELIHSAGGLAFLAHPGIARADRHIDEFIDYGLDGIEVYHPFHSESQRKTYLEIVEKRGLLACGGSDFHGRERHYGMIGSQPVPPEFLTNMKKRLNLK
jgi:predicted metal-dependent phosphoesterase TrpH